MKKALIVIIILLALGSGIFAFLHAISPELPKVQVNRIPPHARNIKKGTTVRAKKRRPRPVKKTLPSKTEIQKDNEK